MLTQIKVYACDTVKFTKTNPKLFQTGARVPGAPVLDPPLAIKCTSLTD